MIQVAQRKLKNHPNFGKVFFHLGDIFHPTLFQDSSYDLVFFGFWLSHVPPEELDGFFRGLVRKSLKKGGHLMFVDSLPTLDSSQDRVVNSQSLKETRQLNDGTKWNIVKIYFNEDNLTAQLNSFGFFGTMKNTGTNFILADFVYQPYKWE